MPGSKAKSRGKSAKRAAILEAARRIFLESGCAAASMDAIALAAKVSKATLYAHFTSKDELFGSMMKARCEEEGLGPVPPEIAALPPKEGLEIIALRYHEFLVSADAVGVFRLTMAEAPRQPTLGRAFYEAGPERAFKAVADYLDVLKSRKLVNIEDSRLAAEQFLGLVRGSLHLKALLNLGGKPAAAEQKRHAKATAAMFLAAYGSR